MGSIRRATQRAVAASVAFASVFLLATCDLDKLTKPADNSGANGGVDSLDLSFTGGNTVTLGGTATLGLQVAGVPDLSGTTTLFSTSDANTISVNSASGLITGMAIGSATITAKLLAPELGEGVSRSQSVRVRYKGILITAPTVPDSMTGLGQTRTAVVKGLNNANGQVATLSTGVTYSAKDTTVLRVSGATATALKNGTTFLVAVFDSLRDSVSVKVRRVARRITFPTTDYTSNAICTGACPNGGRLVPFSAFDIADTLITGPTATWRVLNTSTASVNASTGVLKVFSLDTANRVLVKVDTVERGQRILISQVAGKVVKFAGDSQTAQVAGLVAIAPQVTVTDSGDTPMAGVTVTFAVGNGGGSVTGGTVVTDVNGRATVGSWRLGTVAGASQTLVATAGTGTYTFVATSTPGPAARLTFGAQPSSVGTGATISPSITVRVTDTLNNTVTTGSTSVTLAILANPGLANLGGTLTRSSASGIATFNDITVSATGAGYTLQATGSGLTAGASNTFDVYGAANKLAFLVQPSNGVINQPISPAVKVAVQDANGITVTTATNTITLSNIAGPTTVLNGVVSATAVNGVATFSGISAPVAGAGYQIRATASLPTLANNTANSNSFTLAAIGPAVKVGFTIQPADATAGSTITPATGVRVAIQDANGATVTTASAQIVLSFETNAGNGTLSGTTTLTTTSGLATFSGLSINKTGVSYKLRADVTGGTLTAATSSAFNITAGTFSKLRFEQQPTAVVAASSIAPAVKVAASDALDNTVTTASTSITLTSACATLTGGTATSTTSGVATFSSLAISNANSNCTLTATGGGFGAASSQFNVVAAGGATKIAFFSSATSVTSGQPMTFAVELQNAAGTRVTTASASITLSIANNTGNVALGGTTTLTTTNGLATFNGLIIGTAGTGYTLTASATGYSPATSGSFNVVPSAAKKVAFLTQPSNAVAGVFLSPSPRVAIQDSAGNTVTSATTPILLSFNANPGGGALGGTTLVTPTNGIATFSDIRIAKSGTGYSFFASVPNTSLTNATSNSFDIAVGTAAGFAFTVQPTNAVAGATITPAVQVQIVDNQGNSVTTGSPTITVALSGGTGGAVLGGGTTQGTTLGLATFANLNVNTPGTGYRLNASSSGLTGSPSNTFDISVGAPTKLLFTTTPSIMTVGAASTFTVAITDNNQNTVTSASANITLAINTGSGVLGGTLTQATINGVATFNNITLSAAGAFTLLATSSPAFTSATSSSITVANQSVSISSGNGQTGTVGSNVAANPVVVVKDGAGNPVNGIGVTFTTTGNATLNNSSATSFNSTTAGGGLLSVIWKLRTTSGPDTLIASLNSSPSVLVRFIATASPGAANTITKTAGDNQTAAISSAVAVTPQVKVADSFGNGISGASVTFAVATGGGVVTSGSTTTNATGFASPAGWALGSSPGTNTMTATSGVLTTTFTATATSSDPCLSFITHTIGTTSNGSLDASDCNGPTTPREQFNVTTSGSNTFFSATLASSVFGPSQYAKVWAPFTSRLFLSGASTVTLYYLLANAATYEIDVEKASGSTGAFTLSSTLNPSIPSSCISTVVTQGINSLQSMNTGCTVAHDAGSSIPTRVSSVRYYYILQPANTPITVRMNAGTLSDPYLEAKDVTAGGTFITYNDDDSGLSSVMVIPSLSTARFVEIRAMHYVASGGATVSGDYTLIIDP